MRLGNGRWETAKFNERMQVTELGLGASATDAGVWKTNYEYGELQTNGTVDTTKNTGNIAKQILSFSGPAHPLVQSYKYDSLYRITEAKETANGSQNWVQNWGYDRYGNRTGFTQNIGGLTTAPNPTIDANTNRFNGSQGFSYDKNGNVVNDIDPITSLGRQFIFNGDNKQTEVKKDSVTIGRYYYDGEGKRVKKVTDTETTVFVYSGGKLIAEYSTNVAPFEDAKVAYTTTDHLGTPRVITDQFGVVVSRRDFLPFGEEIHTGVGGRSTNLDYGSTEDNVRQKFTGYQKDTETSLDFAEARMYENRFGRFTAVDPLPSSMNPSKPQSFNRYVYCMNSPFRYIDKNGEYPTEVHNAMLKDAFPGLSKSELAMMQWGSASVDTLFGTGSFYQFGRNGNLPDMPRISFTLDLPITMIPSEAHKHAMIPSGRTRDEAVRMADNYISENLNQAISQQLAYDAFGGNLSVGALVSFGKAAHTMMDSYSPAHRFFQRYEGPTGYGLIPGSLPVWALRQLQHKEMEKSPTDTDRKLAIETMQINFLATFGRRAFESAVTDVEVRERIYSVMASQRYQFTDSVPTSVSIDSTISIPSDMREYHRQIMRTRPKYFQLNQN